VFGGDSRPRSPRSRDPRGYRLEPIAERRHARASNRQLSSLPAPPRRQPRDAGQVLRAGAASALRACAGTVGCIRVPALDQSEPAPFGPIDLCADSDSRSKRARGTSTESAGDCTASVLHPRAVLVRIGRARHRLDSRRHRCWRGITETSAGVGRRSTSRSRWARRGPMRPPAQSRAQRGRARARSRVQPTPHVRLRRDSVAAFRSFDRVRSARMRGRLRCRRVNTISTDRRQKRGRRRSGG